jgi:hypothetical protein
MAKNPQINTFTNLRGVDGQLQLIQNQMSFSWLDNAFGCAEIIADEEGAYPVFFNTNESDPQDLRPNDQWVDYCFWTYGSPGEVSYSEGMDMMVMRKGKTYVTYQVACIFYMKLPTTANYKVTKTQRRQEIWEFFDTLTGYAGIITPTSIVDHDIKSVFEGFELGRLDHRWFMLPYYGIRINANLTFRNYCA